ncbi:hypothetical protein [Kineococcus rubinsiae]|uniref:hypothetical protein n=1 Tax=Kineococcus rubinsiae TaxID=2609562 RepID=UPI0014318157|nr:hypothetical protein [Kineococcus rubinsiae]NIZ89720.1 hypothetical protein [Kineococcus rubinsiae]
MDDHLGDDPFADRVAPRIGELTAEAQRRGLALEPRLDGDWDLFEQTPDGRRAITVEGAPPGSGLTQELVAAYLSSTER